jgi:hypothetical protein
MHKQQKHARRGFARNVIATATCMAGTATDESTDEDICRLNFGIQLFNDDFSTAYFDKY